MAQVDKQYHSLLDDILKNGFKYEDPNRKNVFRYQIPHYQFVHDFKDGFPAITTKKLYWKGVVGELLWILRGSDNIKYLVDNGINIWNKDAYNYYFKKAGKNAYLTLEEFEKSNLSFTGDLGRVYGAQWRNFNGISKHKVLSDFPHKVDQISNLIKGLKETPMGTRHIVTAWNPAELDDMALPPCHWSFEILVEPLSIEKQAKLNKNLDNLFQKNCIGELWEECVNKYNIPRYQFTLKWHQRSVDTFLGLPFNIASYALLAHIIGKMTNMVPKGIIGDLSNVHIYEPHLDAVREQLNKDVDKYDKCELSIKDRPEYDRLGGRSYECSLDNFLSNLEISDFTLSDYQSYPSIKAEMLSYDKK